MLQVTRGMERASKGEAGLFFCKMSVTISLGEGERKVNDCPSALAGAPSKTQGEEKGTGKKRAVPQERRVPKNNIKKVLGQTTGRRKGWGGSGAS